MIEEFANRVGEISLRSSTRLVIKRFDPLEVGSKCLQRWTCTYYQEDVILYSLQNRDELRCKLGASDINFFALV